MSKDAVISEILALPIDDRYEVLRALQASLAEEFVLNDEQEQELDRRIDRIENGEYKGRPWKEVLKELETRRNARHSHG